MNFFATNAMSSRRGIKMGYRLLWILLCGVSTLSHAVIITKYKITSSHTVTSDSTHCGRLLSGIECCGPRATNTTCELKQRTVCELKNFNSKSTCTYIVKQSVTDKLEVTRIRKYERRLPIHLGPGSGIDLKVIPCFGLSKFTVELRDDSNNVVLQMSLGAPDKWVMQSRVNNVWMSRKDYVYRLKTDVEVKVNIVADIDKFIIHLDGTTKEYNSTISPSNVTKIKSYFIGSMCPFKTIKYITGVHM